MSHSWRTPVSGLAIWIAFAFGAPRATFAQSAQLSGQVRDPSGAVVVGAGVSVIHLDSGLHRSTVSGSDGMYAVSSLPEGEYKITVRKTRFRTVARLGVHLGPGDAARLDFALEIGGMEEFITIEGKATTINTDDATSGIRINEDGEDQMQRLPVNGR